VIFFALHDLPVHERHHVATLFMWVPSGGLRVGMGFLADPLSVTFILFITGVGLLIHVFSVGYMHGDPRFSRFFAYLNLFVASMLVLVLGSSLLVTFLREQKVNCLACLIYRAIEIAPLALHLDVCLVDVIVTTHKTLALVFHTQVYKLKRKMSKHNLSASVSQGKRIWITLSRLVKDSPDPIRLACVWL